MKTYVSILTLCLSAAVFAQTEEVNVDTAYFHPAASLYIHGDTPAASNLVAQGLAQFPDDGKLLRLKELLEKQQEQNQDQQDQQNEEQNEDQQNQEQNQQDQQDEQQNQNQQNEDQQDQNQQDQQNQDQQQQQDEQPGAEQMSRDEAEQLLDAMKQEEENKRLQLLPVRGTPVKVEKDW